MSDARYHARIATDEEVLPVVMRARFAQKGLYRFAWPVPDVVMALMLAAAAAMDALTPEQLAKLPPRMLQARDGLFFVLVVEGGFLLMQGTLVDIATRLKKRPPWWAAVLILIGAVVFSQYSLEILKLAWERGSMVFVPLLISLAERGFVLWTMPGRARIEKIAERALIANRITTGLAAFGLVTAAMVIGVVSSGLYDFVTAAAWPMFTAGALYYAIGAYDEWRVRGAKFASRPRVLFRYDPIGIDYLEPV